MNWTYIVVGLVILAAVALVAYYFIAPAPSGVPELGTEEEYNAIQPAETVEMPELNIPETDLNVLEIPEDLTLPETI